jgi:hypothetical protein
MEQNRIPRYKSTQLCPQILMKAPETYDGEKIASPTNATWKTGYLPAEN